MEKVLLILKKGTNFYSITYYALCTSVYKTASPNNSVKRRPNSCTKRKKFVDVASLNGTGTKPCSWVMINYVTKTEIIRNPFNTTRCILTGLRMNALFDAFSIVIIHIIIYPFKGATRVD